MFCLWNLRVADGKLVISRTGRKSSDLLLYIGEERTDMENKENLYASIPYVDKKVSRIFAGTAFPPIQDGADGTEFFEAALANGINAFDTARSWST